MLTALVNHRKFRNVISIREQWVVIVLVALLYVYNKLTMATVSLHWVYYLLFAFILLRQTIDDIVLSSTGGEFVRICAKAQ